MILLLVTGVQAQSNSEGAIKVFSDELTDSWKQLSIIDGLIFSAKSDQCANATDRVLIKIENTTDRRFMIEWELVEKWTMPQGLDSVSVENRDVFLSKSEVIEGTCDVNSDYYYLLSFGLKTGYSVLKEFTFSNLKITEYEN